MAKKSLFNRASGAAGGVLESRMKTKGRELTDEENEEDYEENNCEAGTYDCDTCPNKGDCIRQNEED